MQWGNWDGALVLAFTSPGPRVLNMNELRGTRFTKDKRQPLLAKAENQVEVLTGRVEEDTSAWLRQILEGYDPEKINSPQIGNKDKKELAILLTVESSLGFSTRQPFCDYKTYKKGNVAIKTPKYAT